MVANRSLQMTKRKMIDSFGFFNELSTLNMRLHELNDFVDYFVLVESTVTFAGKPKPLFYKENEDRFKAFRDKIIHVVINDMPESNDPWDRENHQRTCLKKAVSLVPDICATDIILVSDLDEIPNPKYLSRALFDDDKIYVFNQRFFYYDFSCENVNGWPGSMSFPYHIFMDADLNRLRKPRVRKKDKRVNYLPFKMSREDHGGWHCSYFGGVDRLIDKLEAYAHQQYNSPKYKDRKGIEARIRDKKDPVLRWKKKYRLSANDEETDAYLPKYRRLVYADV